MFELRDYQQQLFNDIHLGWDQGHKCVVAVSPTGSGKTVLFSSVILNHIQNSKGKVLAAAHRQELISQMSLTLARWGIKHTLLTGSNSSKMVRMINKLHLDELGQTFYDPTSDVMVSSVQTLARNGKSFKKLLDDVTLYIGDEGHHTLRDNIWGKAMNMVPNAKSLLVTATPCRADGQGLGRHADGFGDIMVEGPSMRRLINQGHLCEYDIYCFQSGMNLDELKTGKNGDWSMPSLAKASKKSAIVGDIVEHYIKIAYGKRGITFVTDLETAAEVAAQYNACGVPAVVLHANTPDLERATISKRFKAGEILQIVNVDILGEGYDCPAVEVVSFARPTKSYGLYIQQFGRVLRILKGKLRGIIIDHVGNVMRHGLPDKVKHWTLDRRDTKKSSGPDDAIPLTTCTKCFKPYERIYAGCPYCFHVNVPAERSKPEQVDGDLTMLDPATLAKMRGEADEIMDTTFADIEAQCNAKNMPRVGVLASINRHKKLLQAQGNLRDRIDTWGSKQRNMGKEDGQSYREFYYKFGRVDVVSAQALGAKDAVALTMKIQKELNE